LLPTKARQSMLCPIPRSKARAAVISLIFRGSGLQRWAPQPGIPASATRETTARRARSGSLALELQHAVGLSALFQFTVPSRKFAGREPSGAFRRNRISLKAPGRAQGAQGAHPPLTTRLPVVAANHTGDHVFPRAPQYLQHVGMRGARVVVKELDPPIAFPADFSGGLQNGSLQHLPAPYRLDCAYQAMTAVGIA